MCCPLVRRRAVSDFSDESGTEPDVVVHVRPAVVQVKRSQARVRPVVPVAATDRDPFNQSRPCM